MIRAKGVDYAAEGARGTRSPVKTASSPVETMMNHQFRFGWAASGKASG